ncbi:MAG TPA: hypothetical protein VFE52_09220, partial [Devosia sp.]|nr:hypothetical protein [Devosia sp.]
MMMIGSFLFSGRPRPDDIAVWLQRGGKGGAARIVLPPRIERALIDQNYPPPAPSMSIESAMSYAIFLSIRTGSTLVITGDREAWNPDWGYLTDLGQFPAAGLVAQG